MDSAFQISSLAALVVNLFLGFLVLAMNPHRRSNRYYAVASAAFSAYAACLALGGFAEDSAILIFWVRQASLTSAILPFAFDLLRLGITHADSDNRLIARELWPWAALIPIVAVITQLPSFVLDCRVNPAGFPSPTYGWAQIPYVAYWVVALGVLGSRYREGLTQSRGIERTELQFTVLAFVSSAIYGLGLAQILPLLTGSQDVGRLMPLSIVVLNVVLAYGIVTQRIMSVSDVLRRLTAYGLVAAYLLLLYVGVNALMAWLLVRAGLRADPASHIIAAMAVAFSMAPAHGRMQRVANRLFISMGSMDIRATLHEANEALMSIGTVDELLERFGRIVVNATGTDHVLIYLREDAEFRLAYAQGDETRRAPRLAADDALVAMLARERQAVTLVALRRARRSPARDAAGARLDAAGAAVAVGIRAKDKLEGVLFLGARLSGRIYGVIEQGGLQLLCDQLGVGLDNARLYTQTENSRIYNDILLDSLVSGIVAANTDRTVTVFNQAARRITGLEPAAVVGGVDRGVAGRAARRAARHAGEGRAPDGRRPRHRDARGRAGADPYRRIPLPRAHRRTDGRAGGLQRHDRRAQARGAGAAHRPSGEPGHALGRHGPRDQEPARIDPDLRAASARAL